MDARERLRLYLEQRRELGESELVLDTLPMADALALIGAAAPAGGARKPAAPRRSSTEAEAAPASASPAPSMVRERAPDPAPEASRPPATDSEAPPAPTPRFDPSVATRDWRSALRAEGLAGDVPVAPVADPASPPPAPAARTADVPAWLAALDIPLGLTVGSAQLAPSTAASLADVAAAVATCTACPLAAGARQAVPGEGNPQAGFVCVGEGPGQQEDETGRPFVGPSGELLTKILAAIKFTREDVFICNVVKHRPPGNRTPTPEEIHACRPYLEQQLGLLRPRVILALGSTAANTLLGTSQSLGSLRGHVHRYHGVPVVVTYHPSALLRNEAWKRPAWQDVQLARRIHDAAIAASAT
jgi:uracil-DNA glycosylase